MVRYLITTLSLSVACISSAAAFGGVYIGADLGMGQTSITHKYNDVARGTGKSDKSTFGGVYGAHVGYLHEIGTSKTIVGGELYTNLSSMHPSMNFGVDGLPIQGDVKIKRSSAIGIAVIAGKMFNLKTMLYGRVAYEKASYQTQYRFSPGSVITSHAGHTIKKNVSIMAPVIGMGIAYKPARMIIVGGEYQFAGLYDKKGVLNEAGIRTSIEPVEHRLLVKVSFAFG